MKTPQPAPMRGWTCKAAGGGDVKDALPQGICCDDCKRDHGPRGSGLIVIGDEPTRPHVCHDCRHERAAQVAVSRTFVCPECKRHGAGAACCRYWAGA